MRYVARLTLDVSRFFLNLPVAVSKSSNLHSEKKERLNTKRKTLPEGTSASLIDASQQYALFLSGEGFARSGSEPVVEG